MAKIIQKKKVIVTLCKVFPVAHFRVGEPTEFEKKEGWINLYEFNSVIAYGTKVYGTEENAKSEIGNKSENYISTIK